jgi:uncharacterized membrane protein YcaP (DUF421 family)
MDLHDLLIGPEGWGYLLETALRTTLMFVLVLLLFMLTGKKEVRQFSVLELIVIIGLGSALGDPMLHPDSPVLPALVTIAMVLLLYRVVNVWTNRSPRVGRMVEGRVRTLFKDGRIDHDALLKEGMSVDEFFGDLRMQHIEHLGQVKAAHLEVDGGLSVYFLPDEEVRPGLPIGPDRTGPQEALPHSPTGHVSCAHCGYTATMPLPPGSCIHCGHRAWLASLASKRVG